MHELANLWLMCGPEKLITVLSGYILPDIQHRRHYRALIFSENNVKMTLCLTKNQPRVRSYVPPI